MYHCQFYEVECKGQAGGFQRDTGPDTACQVQLQQIQVRAAKRDCLSSDAGNGCLQEKHRQVETLCRQIDAAWLWSGMTQVPLL